MLAKAAWKIHVNNCAVELVGSRMLERGWRRRYSWSGLVVVDYVGDGCARNAQ